MQLNKMGEEFANSGTSINAFASGSRSCTATASAIENSAACRSVFLQGIPKLVLGWINFGGVRMPLYLEIDRTRLRKARALKNTYYYDEVTTDPRFENMRPLPEPRPPA
jgi:hypothetical protein